MTRRSYCHICWYHRRSRYWTSAVCRRRAYRISRSAPTRTTTRTRTRRKTTDARRTHPDPARLAPLIERGTCPKRERSPKRHRRRSRPKKAPAKNASRFGWATKNPRVRPNRGSQKTRQRRLQLDLNRPTGGPSPGPSALPVRRASVPASASRLSPPSVMRSPCPRVVGQGGPKGEHEENLRRRRRAQQSQAIKLIQ